MADIVECVNVKVDNLAEERILEIAIDNAIEKGGAFE